MNSLATAAADVSTMGDKVAAFAIAQNFLWTYHALKGDLRDWIKDNPRWFFGGTTVACLVYVSVEICLCWHASELINTIGYIDNPPRFDNITPHLLCTSKLLFVMRELGIAASSLVAGLAFSGARKAAAESPVAAPPQIENSTQ